MFYREILQAFEQSDGTATDAEQTLELSGCGSLLELYEAVAEEDVDLNGGARAHAFNVRH